MRVKADTYVQSSIQHPTCVVDLQLVKGGVVFTVIKSATHPGLLLPEDASPRTNVSRHGVDC